MASGHVSGDSGRLAAVAVALRPQALALSDRVMRRILEQMPPLADDPDLLRETTRSTEANIARFLDLFEHPELPVATEIAPEILSLGVTLLRRGREPGELVHAYLLGQNEFWRAWVDLLAEHAACQDEDVLALCRRSSERMMAWVDFVVAELMHRWEAERSRWAGGALARRIDLVRQLLHGEGPDEPTASRALGYDLGASVTAAILWTDDDDEQVDELEERASLLAAAAGADRALTVPVGVSTLWAWVATYDAPQLDAVGAALAPVLRPCEGVALGLPGQGLAGFRDGHHEARHARRIAELAGARGIVRYDEVEAVSLLSQDPERLRRFARRRLGPLAADDPALERVRETLLVWLEEGGNARRAAERLYTHKNTVLYRVQRARELLEHPPEEDRLSLQLALLALAQLGPRLGTDPSARTNPGGSFGRSSLVASEPDP